jgi:hypothetical protein
MAGGTAVPHCRAWDCQTLGCRALEGRIWQAWDCFAGHPATGVRCVLVRGAPGHPALGSTYRHPAHDWFHRWTEGLVGDPEGDLAPIVPCSDPPVRAHLVERAAGTLSFFRSLHLYRSGRGAARGGTANRGGRQRAEDRERSWTSSRVGPRAWVSLVFRRHSTRRVDSAVFHLEYPAWLGASPAVRYPVSHRAGLRCAQVAPAASQPMRDEAGLRHGCPHLSWPSALRLPGAWLLASTLAGRGRSRVGRVASIPNWLWAGRRPALAPAPPRDQA